MADRQWQHDQDNDLLDRRGGYRLGRLGVRLRVAMGVPMTTIDTRRDSNRIVAAAQEIGRQGNYRLWPVALVCEWAHLWASSRRSLAALEAGGGSARDIKDARAWHRQAEDTLSEMILDGQIHDD